MTSLCFSKACTKSEGGAPSVLTGSVEVQFFELGGAVWVDPKLDYAPAKLTGGSNVGGKKCVVSTNGSIHEKKAPAVALNVSYAQGKHLGTVTLHYCTALGLIVNKILDPPPEPVSAGNESQLVTPEKTTAQIKLEKRSKRQIATDEDGGSVAVLPSKKRAIETIDLTGDD